MPEIKKVAGVLYRYWPAEKARAVLLLVHGLGAHSARWDFLAEFFAKQGIASYAIELKGFGETKATRGHIDSFQNYYRDILILFDFVSQEHLEKKVFILGESMGGLIAFNLAGMNPELFAGQILISPAFENGMKFPFSAYLTLVSSLLFNPKKLIPVPFTSAMCTRDESYQKVMDNSSLEFRSASAKLLFSTLLAQTQAKKLAEKTRVPALFLLAGKDYLVDENGGRRLFKKIKLQDKSLVEYPEMYHALSIDLDREKVFSDILSWMNRKL